MTGAARLAVAALALALGACGTSAPDGVNALTEGWTYRWGDSPRGATGTLDWLQPGDASPHWKALTRPDKIPGRRDRERFVWLRTRLPSELPVSAAILILYVDQSVEVYLDRERLHLTGDLDSTPPRAAVGRPFLMIPLGAEAAGRTLSLRIYSEHAQIGPMGNVYLGPEARLFDLIRRRGAGPLIIGLSALTISLLTLLLLVFDRRDRRVTALAGLALTTGVYSIAMPFAPLKQVLLDAPSLWQYLELGALYLAPACYFTFYASLVRGRLQNAVYAFRFFFLAYPVLALTGSALGLFTPLATKAPFHVALTPAMGFGLVTAGRKIRDGDLELRIFFVGVAIVALAGLRDMLIDHRLLAREVYFSPLGLFVFVISLGFFLIRHYARRLRERNQYLAEMERQNRELTATRTAIAEAVERIGREAHSLAGAASRQLTVSTDQVTANHETTAAATEIAQTSSVAAAEADAVVATALKSQSLYGEGRQMVEQAIEGVEQLSGHVQSIAATITGLAERSARIGEITSAMKEVSDRSNLLALNAQIEARRAGEHGRGFEVVAREMRALAQESKDATLRVRALLEELLRDTRRAVQQTELGRSSAEAVVERARGAGEAISGLAGVISDSGDAVRRIAVGAREQAAGVQQIVAAMSDSSSAIEEALAGTRGIDQTSRDLSLLAATLAQLAASERRPD